MGFRIKNSAFPQLFKITRRHFGLNIFDRNYCGDWDMDIHIYSIVQPLFSSDFCGTSRLGIFFPKEFWGNIWDDLKMNCIWNIWAYGFDMPVYPSHPFNGSVAEEVIIHWNSLCQIFRKKTRGSCWSCQVTVLFLSCGKIRSDGHPWCLRWKLTRKYTNAHKGLPTSTYFITQLFQAILG